MLTSISPLGERARGNRWAVTATAYVVGSALGGLTIGSFLGAVGRLLPHPIVAAAAMCAVAALLEVTRLVPSRHRQVDEDWLTRYRGWVYGLAFGFQLGLAVVTVVTSAATYALLGLCLLTGGWAALLGGTFGLVRALPLLQLRSVTTVARLRRSAARRAGQAALARRATAGVLAAGAAMLLVTS